MPEINYGSFKQKVDEKGRWLVNFSAALAAMRRGEKVARAHWGGYWEIESYQTLIEKESSVMIVAHLKDGGIAPATPYMEDLLAEDWVVIGREEEVPTPDKEDYKEAAEQSIFFGKGITAGTIEGGQIIGMNTPDETVGHLVAIAENAVEAEMPAQPEDIWALIETLKVLDVDREGDLRLFVANKLVRALGAVEAKTGNAE